MNNSCLERHLIRPSSLELSESVQERFDATFGRCLRLRFPSWAWAMNSDAGVPLRMWSFVMSMPISLERTRGWSVNADHPGHRFRSLNRRTWPFGQLWCEVRRLLDNYETTEDPRDDPGDSQRLVTSARQWSGWSALPPQEELMFPIMERYGHDSPPKSCGGGSND